MEKLTIEKAKQICFDTFNKFPDKENGQFNILHCKLVSEIVLILAEKKDVDKEILEIAAWTHDIGKIIEKENHGSHSLEILERDYEIPEKLRDCMLNHATKSKPATDEGKIFRHADKLSALHPDLIKNFIDTSPKRRQKTINFIRGLCTKIPEILKDYET